MMWWPAPHPSRLPLVGKYVRSNSIVTDFWYLVHTVAYSGGPQNPVNKQRLTLSETNGS